MSRRFKVFIAAEDGDHLEYIVNAPDHYKAVEWGMDKAFKEHPDRRFLPGGYEEVEQPK